MMPCNTFSELSMIVSLEVNRLVVAIYILLVHSCLHIAVAVNKMTATQILNDSATMVSENGSFMVGFFSPSNTKYRYLGIWYKNIPVKDYVWVANRNRPIVGNSGVLKISQDGNLQVLNGRNDILWSSNISLLQSNNSSRVARILDSGNLVLQESDGSTVWQSFDHPTDSVLPNMTLRITSSNMKTALQSWKSPSDPSIGRFSLGTDSLIHPQLVIWDGDAKFWRSGPWNGNLFLGLDYNDPSSYYADTYFETVNQGEVSLVFTGISKLLFSHYSFDYDGRVNEISWVSYGWETIYRAPDVECDIYGKCGAFGTCNSRKSPICRCLRGFSPKNIEEWSNGNWSSGCVRNNPLLCGNKTTQDGFLMIKNIKLPDFASWLKGLNPNDCRKQCLENCSCLAYAFDNGAGCLHWSGDLIDIQEFTRSVVNIFLRLSHSDLAKNNTKQKGIIAGAVIFSTTLIVLLIFFLRRRLILRKEARKQMLEIQRMRNDTTPVELKDLPCYSIQDLVIATNNFHEANKLGQGGFGQVYKGIFKNGQEIAVKRLSRGHGQGLQEFTNEVAVISGLQHMNLVRLHGFCIEGEERILVYEYMPNKSLDAFLFDPAKREILDWSKRYNIIEGICRGLVYLHRDSRLRIIHRDLKAANILLDKDLNAKIADFGMARIFGRFQDQEETRRVVGTFGYMAPEYALEGNFSEKSDVYSFGVLLLEIVTGQRNNTFWYDEQSLTLLGYVWNFWIEGNVGAVLDPLISDPSFRNETQKCIQVGLLCVQEFVRDRPSMSTVITMLAGDIADLPNPKKPGFTRHLAVSDSESTQMLQHSYSTNEVSITSLSAR